jgi:hypothetical protein
MTWILLFFLLWMSFRLILSLGHSAESAASRLNHPMHFAKTVNGGWLTRLMDDDNDGRR